jgi:hypothetical protein
MVDCSGVAPVLIADVECVQAANATSPAVAASGTSRKTLRGTIAGRANFTNSIV